MLQVQGRQTISPPEQQDSFAIGRRPVTLPAIGVERTEDGAADSQDRETR
jgi:hypothetical protein